MFRKPNYTQTPNEFFDDIAKTLKEGELRVLLVIMRQTFGWGNKAWDRISITQLMDKTGMQRWAVVKSTKSLVEKGLITKHKEGRKGEEQSWYSLVVESPSEFQNPIDNSNNCYQSSKETPPSLLKRPTKETLTKERKESSHTLAKEKSEQAPPPPPESFYKEKFENKIQISLEQRNRLVTKFGNSELIDQYAERLFRYSLQKPKKFKEYKRHDLTIEDWIEKDLEKKKPEPRFDSGLNESQLKNWNLNQELVQDLKIDCPHKANGLNWYYKNHILKDRNNPQFDVSGLINHKDFCRLLEKHLGLKILEVRFPNG